MAISPHGSGRTIEELLGLQATRVELGLIDEPEPVVVGPDARFRVHRRLGGGSMGAVYLADDLRLKREVALKVVASRRIEHGSLERRLAREAQALAALRHANVVQVYDLASTEAGEMFIAMEYVPGEDLRHWQRDRSLDELTRAYLLAGRGLAAAHERGLVHRDFKPDNVLIDEHSTPPRVLVGDFGLAGVEPELLESSPGISGGAQTTSRGLMGTVAYMAPEQLRRELADSRSDQHQFCVALWEAIARARPFPDEGRPAGEGGEVPPRPAAMPRWMYRVLRRGLARDRADRFPRIDDLLSALERGRRWQEIWPWIAAMGLLGLVSVGVWSWLEPDPCDDAEARVIAVWDDDARGRVDASIRGASVPYAPELAGHVIEGLDEAAQGWAAQARGACEAQQEASVELAAEAERRLRCVDRATARLARVVELLGGTGTDMAVLERAHALVASVRVEGDECSVPPMPIEPRVSDELDAVAVLQLLGRDEQAGARAEAAVELAARLGRPCGAAEQVDEAGRPYSSELAAALLRLGLVEDDRGASEASLQALDEAHAHALACEDELRDADVWIHRAKILAVDFGSTEDARRALREAELRLLRRRTASVSARRHEQWKAAGLIADRDGDTEQARGFYGRSLDALGELERHPTEAAKIVHNIGITYYDDGRYAEARQAYDRAVQLVSETLGPLHPQTRERHARRALADGLICIAEERWDAAAERFDEVVEHGDPVLAAKALTAGAQSEHQADRMEAAERRARALLAHLRRHPELRPALVAAAKTTAGQVLADRGRPESIALLDEAIVAWAALEDAHNLAAARFLRAMALHAVGRDDEARRAVSELLEDPTISRGHLAEPLRALADALAASAPNPNPDPPTESEGPPP